MKRYLVFLSLAVVGLALLRVHNRKPTFAPSEDLPLDRPPSTHTKPVIPIPTHHSPQGPISAPAKPTVASEGPPSGGMLAPGSGSSIGPAAEGEPLDVDPFLRAWNSRRLLTLEQELAQSEEIEAYTPEEQLMQWRLRSLPGQGTPWIAWVALYWDALTMGPAAASCLSFVEGEKVLRGYAGDQTLRFHRPHSPLERGHVLLLTLPRHQKALKLYRTVRDGRYKALVFQSNKALGREVEFIDVRRGAIAGCEEKEPEGLGPGRDAF